MVRELIVLAGVLGAAVAFSLAANVATNLAMTNVNPIVYSRGEPPVRDQGQWDGGGLTTNGSRP